MSTKRSLMDVLLAKAIEEAINSVIADYSNDADALRRVRDVIVSRSCTRLIWDNYRWLNVCDIMAWRKRAIQE